MKIKTERWLEHIEEYRLEFSRTDIPGAGFSFPCNAKGEILVANLHEASYENYLKCKSKEHPVGEATIFDYSRDYKHDTIYECDRCHGDAGFSYSCATVICDECGNHLEKARCWCGWTASGSGRGRQELEEFGEVIDDE